MAGDIHDWNSKLILVKAEATDGTDSVPALAADAIRVRNFTPTFLDADQKVRTLEKAYFGADPTGLSNFRRGFTADMDWSGGGTAAGTAIPPWMKVLAFCGMGAPVVGANSVTQSPRTVGIPSASVYYYIDDLRVIALGTRGGVGFTFQDDEYPIFSLNMLGAPPSSLIDQVTPPAVQPDPSAYPTPLVASTEVSTFVFDGYAYPLRSWTMSDNAQISQRSLINPKDRTKYGGRSWSGTLVIRVPDLNVANPFAKVRSGATAAATAVHGTASGNIVQASSPALQITGAPSLSNEDGEVMATIPVTALPVLGNDEVVFTSK